jgi:hypothetical protein
MYYTTVILPRAGVTADTAPLRNIVLALANSIPFAGSNPAAADFIFLLALGMEIMKYTLVNIFNLSYYGVNNNTT